MLATPSCFAIWGRLSGVLLKCCVEVREMTFRSATFAKRVRISSCTPSQKYALSGSRLRLSNGSTAIDLLGASAIDFAGRDPAVAGGRPPSVVSESEWSARRSRAGCVVGTTDSEGGHV